MEDKFSVTERAKIAAWYEWTKSVTIVQRKFRSEFNKEPPVRNTILHYHKSLMEIGSVQNVQKKRKRTSRTDENVQGVLDHFRNDPHSSMRRTALALAMSRTTIQRVLHDAKWHPYKVQVVHKLFDEDKANRIQFATEELARIETDEMHLARLVWSDESHFHLDGGVNRHNHRYWSPTNPNWITEQSLHSPRTTVWAAIWQGGIFGPFFFDENVKSVNYLEMLQRDLWPAMEASGMSDELIFMQDGAPPHWGLQVRQWLNETLPERWMGRGSPNMQWPPRSPDLTPCDYFLWGFIKSKVYATKPANIAELKERIKQAFREITVEMRHKVALEYQERLRRTLENNGDHVEVHN